MKNTPKINLHLPRSLSPARYKSRNKSPSPSPSSETSEPSGEKPTTLRPGVSAIATGSSTGNPRNKCALQPGHSLMDWIRLGNSGKDLSGTGGRLRAVTPKELEQHNQMENAWIAIRGRVYNVTEYMDYHPGGPDELMRGVGTDATKLFDQIHAWVNYESLLSKCLVGPLKHPDMSEGDFNKIMFGDNKASPKKESNRGIPEILRKSMESLKGNKLKSDSKDGNTLSSLIDSDFTNKSSSESSLNINESKSSEKSSTSNSTVKVADIVINVSDETSNTSDEYSSSKFKYPKFTLTEADKSDSVDSKSVDFPKNIVPKFDWIQKTDSIALIFYTKGLSNAICSVELIKDSSQKLIIKLSYDTSTYQFNIVLEHTVNWPCSISANHETGKYEIVLIKETPKIWNSFGTMNTMDAIEQTIIINENSLEYCVVDKINITHNTMLILLKCLKNEFITFPIGHHSRIFYCKEDLVSRAYTPVPAYLVSQYKPAKWTPDTICFMVKKYDQGEASTWLTSRNLNDHITISRPIGTFNLKLVQDVTQFCLIAAGTGLTPMLHVIQFALQKRNPRCKRVDLLFFNRSEKDILWHDQLSVLSNRDERFHLTNTLSTPSSTWDGQRGHVNQSLLINYFLKTYSDEFNLTDSTHSSPTKTALENLLQTLQKELFICICGPTAFTKLVHTLLIGLGTNEEQIHCFLG